MQAYDDLGLKCCVKHQGRLFLEPVAAPPQEAEAFLEECMAVVVNCADEVREYFEEEGTDIGDGDDLLEASEVFDVGDGRFLIVEG